MGWRVKAVFSCAILFGISAGAARGGEREPAALQYEDSTSQCGSGVWGVSADGARAALCVEVTTAKESSDPDVMVTTYSVAVVEIQTGKTLKTFHRVFHSELPMEKGAALDTADESKLTALNVYLRTQKFVLAEGKDEAIRKRMNRK